ncbi:Zinc finger RING-type [Penicillium antarcticum]|uniref:Zinc finger RING-type n=1 Tax=Penicillium antarcticum TaxID=416450 RepID=UPI0023A587D8|nr:Zinc finger RING-type [Penicillium antarcticum]KAJ5316883.1 Zinc finger RING-type [Penicillium antarcticum]
MASCLGTYLLKISTLVLGLAIMVIMILVKEWTQYQAAQFWPKLPVTGPPDLESSFAFSAEAWRMRELEASWSLYPLRLTHLSQLLNLMASSH